MKENELIIGNYIEFNNDSSTVKVKEICEFGLTVEAINPDEEDFYTEHDEFSGILLNQENITELGFSRVSGWDNYVGWKKGEVEIEEIEPNKKYNNYLDLEIKYVHELQNLYFALTKQELTFKN